MRWQAGAGFVRLERHLARMQASAKALEFPFDADKALAALDAVAKGVADLRVRLDLSRDGGFSTIVQDYVEHAPGTVWTLKLARTQIDSRYKMLRHKTTRRSFYEAARAEFPRRVADEVILTNERGEICEGTFTNIFVDDGGRVLLTPSQSCGLLPGIFRAELIQQGKAREAVLSRDDLYEARDVLVGNSLRGLIKARML